MAIIDIDLDVLERAYERIKAYLAAIANSIASHPDGPLVNFDFDTIGQLMTPHRRESPYSGILWHSVMQADALGTVAKCLPTKAGRRKQTQSPSQLRRLQIPSGSKKELLDYCKKLLLELNTALQGPEATKLGLEIEDWIRLLSDYSITDDELGRLLREVGEISSTLGLLDTLLKYVGFSHTFPTPPEDKTFQQYLQRIGKRRPGQAREKNNKNDAINLAETSVLRQWGFNAYLVTTTEAVLEAEDQFARDPFYLALEFTIRSHFSNVRRQVATDSINVMIGRLAEFIRYIHEYSLVASLPASASDVKGGNVRQEMSLLGNILTEFGNEPILRQITSLLSDAASAVWLAQEQSRSHRGNTKVFPDVVMLSQVESVINRLRRRLGNVPKVKLRRNQFTSSHLSYSFLDREGRLLFAAELDKDSLAIAWPTEITISTFLESLRQYYQTGADPGVASVLVKIADVDAPKVFSKNTLEKLEAAIFAAAGPNKISLVKVMCGEDIFWYDSSVLYTFDRPEETRTPDSAKIAVSICDRDQVKNLIRFYLDTTRDPCSTADAEAHFRKLFTKKDAFK